MGCDGLRGQPAVDGAQCAESAPKPDLDAAGVLGDVGDQVRIAGLGGVAKGIDDLSPCRQGARDAGVDRPEAVGILPEPAVRAVVPDQRMQVRRRLVAARLHQTGQGLHGLDAPPRIVNAGGLVDQRRVDPVEQRHVEDEIPIVLGQSAPQPRLDPGGDGVVFVARLGDARPRLPRVAVDVQGDRPTGGGSGNLGQFAAREFGAEEPGDVGRREAQFLGGDGRAPALQHEHRDVEAGRSRPERHRHVQVARGGAQELVENGDGIRVVEAFDFVQRQQARRGLALDHAQEQVDRAGCLTVGFHPRGRQARRFAVGAAVVAQLPTRPLEGKGQVGGHRARAVHLREAEPGDGNALLAQVAAAMRQQGRLAEAARRLQHGEPPRHRRATFLENGPRHVAGHGVGQLHPVTEQPVRTAGFWSGLARAGRTGLVLVHEAEITKPGFPASVRTPNW